MVRYTTKYEIVGVVDSAAPSGDAGEVLDGKHRGIPLFASMEEACKKIQPEIFIVGAVSEGGILPDGYEWEEKIESGKGSGYGVEFFVHKIRGRSNS